MEIWKDIPNYEGIYQVSNLGNVKSLNYNHTKKEKLLKTGFSSGYLKVVLYNKNGKKSIKVHSLVAQSFLKHKPNGHRLVVNHINHNKVDNKVENLEIITQRENASQKHIKSTSEYVGVFWVQRSKKWTSKIWINKKQIHLGYFAEELEAHNAYQNKLKCLNTI